jgi:hypothetical protein
MQLENDELAKIFPEKLMAHYAKYPNLKRFEDEARYLIASIFDGAIKSSGLNERLEEAEKAFKWLEEKSPNNDLVMLNPALICNPLLNGTNIVEKRCTFIKSTYFMFIPLSSRDMKNFPYKTTRTKPSINSKAVWDDYNTFEGIMNTIKGSSEGAEVDLVALLNAVDSNSDEKVKAALLAACARIAH